MRISELSSLMRVAVAATLLTGALPVAQALAFDGQPAGDARSALDAFRAYGRALRDGRTDDAVAYIQRILETDPERGYFKRQLTRFQEALAEQEIGRAHV